jgi:putative transposase
LLDEWRKPYGCQVHAFVLMTNHVHLLLTPNQQGAVSDLMRRVNLRFVQAMNRRYGRTGCGWENRFWSSIVENSDYFLRCQRYIELNPIRAGLVKRPELYAWSSHACNAYGAPLPLVEPHDEYLALGSDPDRRRAAYRRLFREDIPEPELQRIRVATRSNLAYGSEAFVDEMELATGRPLRRQRAGRRAKKS